VQSTIHWWISLPWSVWLDQSDKVVQITAVIVGGVWAYLKFIRGRVYYTRLEPSVAATTFRKDGTDYLLATVTLKNVGATKVDIVQEGTALRVFACPAYGSQNALLSVDWNRLRTVSIFQEHAWIEAGETIQDSLLFVLPPNQTAVKMQVRIVATKLEWSAKAIVDVFPAQRHPIELANGTAQVSSQDSDDGRNATGRVIELQTPGPSETVTKS
jgi:hypothetical protein